MTRRFGIALISAASLACIVVSLSASPAFPAANKVLLPIVADGLSGVVTGPNGAEAGVWAIAETSDLPTRLIKIVVTDDKGRYVLPELPRANYKLWVRGYGLVDSQPVQTRPGKRIDLTAVIAPDHKSAALLSGQLLVWAGSTAGGERISRDRPERQRDWPQHA